MSEAQIAATPGRAKMATLDQVSAGGVAFRRGVDDVEVAIVSVGNPARWQLPKGIVDPGETPEVTAVREVREEAGIEATLVAPLDTVEYWYVGHRGKQRVRFHKFVHFYLMAYQSGQLSDHDHEVNEARWVSLEQAQAMLAFKGERQAVAQAASLLAEDTVSKDDI
jgi:8-oxo-dGTP pyrophosphatase MutT (NUDIX family)